ncbi:MAG: hypothetical protein E5X63_06540 [Mesorhizobium sp.]|nr:MAG: hypothetical protein E5X63_06540 [Mesorhizobium sp.]
MRGFIIPTLEFRGRDIAARPAELNPAFLCPIICPAKLSGHWSDVRPLGRTGTRLKIVKLHIVPGIDSDFAKHDAIECAGIPAASMLDRLGIPTLYPPDLGERFDMPADLRRISGLSPPWRGSSVG